jgi:hypothetical protein
MCSCRERVHTDACRAAHTRYNQTSRGYIRMALYEIERKRARAEAAAALQGIEVPWQTS